MTIETEKTSLSFGRYLQSIRIEKGIRLRDVSSETRIRPETLVHIEEEDHAHLPDIVFVKGFLRAYAKAIGADGDEAVRRYISRLEVMQKITTSELDLKRSEGVSFWRRFVLSIGALLCLIVATLYAVSMWRENQAQTEEVPSAITEPVPAEASLKKTTQIQETPSKNVTVPVADDPPQKAGVAATTESAGIVAKDPPANESPIAPGADSANQTPISGYRLNIDTIEETWMKIAVDNQEPKEYNLFPGDQIELEAAESYNLLVGNAAGIKLHLNGKLLDLPGKSGQVVKIELP